jgi:hypothetical protein
MMTFKHYRISYIIAMACALSIAACSSATGPDGTSDTPKPGTSFLQRVTYYLSAGESLDSLKGYDTLLTTVAADNIFNPLNSNSVVFIDSSYHDAIVGKKVERSFLFLPNGDISIRQPSEVVEFFGDTLFAYNDVIAKERFLVYPFGVKRNHGYRLLDTTVTTDVGADKQTTHHTVIDSIFFFGPEMLIIAGEPINTLKVRSHWLATSTATLKGSTRMTQRTIDYTAWYSPKLGYTVQDLTINAVDSLGKGFRYLGGPGRVVYHYTKK